MRCLTQLNNDHCETCHGPGRFICCDGCPRSFHFACVCPPLDVDEMPFPNGTLLPKKTAHPTDARAARALADDSWFCQVCFAQRMPPKAPKGCGPFGVLLQQLARENPRLFELPEDVRTYYKGVGTAPDGSYVDTISQRPLKLSRAGFVEERDPYQLRDKQGEPILCFRCGESSLPRDAVSRRPHETLEQAERRAIAAVHRHAPGPPAPPVAGRRMLSCDFCTLHWHLDCVDPPLTGMPPATRRWRCPAHSVAGQRRVRVPRAPQHTRTITVPPGAKLPPFREGQLVDVVPSPSDRCFDPDTGAGQSRDKPWEDMTLESGTTRVRYRLPEKSIRLEFWAALQARHAAAAHAAPSSVPPSVPPPPPPPPTLWDELLEAATHADRALTHVATPSGAELAEHAAAARASLAANAQSFSPAQRTSYRPAEAEALVPPATEPDDVPPPPAHVPSRFVYPAEIAELRALKAWLMQRGEWPPRRDTAAPL